ncbi:type III secretion system inner membrane ring lipoprotein SctJ [Erwinia pyrifoliae]|uniref:Lipoprotein n=1 Tax=Erwinia pyrifoliae TaxID=79967 RepID=A0ABY5X3E1_ERWPY|nr:type III secretion inner membrane ring lipoprotein SctJ [Erwinia pyrifoliae]MCT2387402.1 type III secretion inner membrane ring lipoprotein SctJ [Erwinia pyrifoliae]MCU8586998.1 type III secretion inner membrane ring lipoprotein SctJ [Erwinia pyrifoliae]UWS31905.1 type III secretion inner membrane ring lipoprotein SctJ [Erwinia pyrifoliae]
MTSKYLHILFVLISAGSISGCNNEKLLENLTQEQTNQVLAILQQHNISAQKSGAVKDGFAISVSQQENTAALSIINQYQLPWSAEIQIAQAFPESALVASPNAEQTRVLSLLEQRLGQSLRIINQVVNARVHISYPGVRSDKGNKTLSHVGVLISYKGEIDDNLFISQIKSLIKNSLSDVRYENISVVLFDAPVIQYSTPMKASRSRLWFWLIPLVICTVLAIFTLVYLINKSPGRSIIENLTPTKPNDKKES